MSRIVYIAALSAVTIFGTRADAQRVPDLNAPRKAAEKAVNAENERLSAQTGQEVRKVGSAQTGKASGPSAPAQASSARPTSGRSATGDRDAAPQVTREVYAYDGGGRRDPFYSLILTDDLRPLLSDLRLAGILYAGAGGKSVAIMRDVQTSAQYRVSTGMTLGRLRVTQIKPRAVIFTIDEFGLSRQDSLFLSDTTKTRIR